MRIKKIPLSDIICFLGKENVCVIGDITNCYIDNLADIAHTNAATLDWVNPAKANKQAIAENSKAKVILVDGDVRPIEDKVLLVVNNPKV